jgi:hypothetical protein
MTLQHSFFVFHMRLEIRSEATPAECTPACPFSRPEHFHSSGVPGERYHLC